MPDQAVPDQAVPDQAVPDQAVHDQAVPYQAGRGTLYVVATPIGNLSDVTFRSLEVLRSVSVVAAEDTRMTHRLFARHEISTPLVSYHAHSSDARRDALLDRLESGDDVALVTDAGTPLVSDPGAELVRAWADRDGSVVPIPGPSAALAALVASGLATARWGFEGFLPRSGAERKRRLARIAADDRATVLFESPGRTAATLRDLGAVAGETRRAAVARELTKRHEEIRRGTLAELVTWAGEGSIRGEVTIVVAGAPDEVPASMGGESGVLGASGAGTSEAAGAAIDAAALGQRVAQLVATGVRRSEAIRRVAVETGIARRIVYAAALDDATGLDDAVALDG